jgi:outer membrane protein insertion porin family
MKRFFLLLPLLLGMIGIARAESFVISDIRVEGLQRISPGTVFNDIPVKVNDRIEQSAIAETARALFRSGNFDDVQIGRDGNVLVITVVERPSISEINIEGNKAIKKDALLDGLKKAGLSVGQVFQRATLEQMRVELQRQYVGQGRYDATIETEVVEQARNRVGVDITISEGTVARIKHINVVGNSVFEDEDLAELFELKTTGWLSWIRGDDKYSREKLNGGLENLSSYYLDRGYIRFNIDSTQVAITPDRKAVYITVNVTEGDKYRVTDVDVSGELILTVEELRKMLLLSEGQDFSQELVTKTEEFITQRLGVEGYTFAKVNGIPEIDDDKKTVALKFFVDPGKRTYVRRIEFRGNTKSIDEVLRREMRQMEAAPASSALIEQSRVRLERLGFYKEVKSENLEVPGTDDMIDVEFKVEEQSSGSIGASVGYAQDAGIILGANLQQNNFLGTGKQIGIGLNASKYQDYYSFNYVDPYFTADGVSRGYTIFYRSTNLDEINVASYTTDTIGANVSFGYPISETKRLGLSVGVTRTKISAGIGAVQEISTSPRPLDDILGYVNSDDFTALGRLLQPQDIVSPVPADFFQPITPRGFLDVNGDTFNNFLLTGTWQDYQLNRGQLATRGHSQSVSVQLSTPGSDLEYYKINYNGEIYFPLWKELTLRLHTELGYGDGWGDTDSLPFYDNFFSGGFGSVRGFKSNTLGPQSTPALVYATRPVFNSNGRWTKRYAYITCAPPASASDPVTCKGPNGEKILFDETFNDRNNNDDDAFGGNLLVQGGAEVLFPLPFIKDQRSVRTGIFVDIGNVFDTNCGAQQLNCSDLDFSELRYSVGFGATWITGFGPITFSLAKPLNDKRFDRTEIFQFSLGQGF